MPEMDTSTTKDLHVHPRVVAYLQNLTLDDLPPLPKLTGSIAKEVRAHLSYKGIQQHGFEEPEGSQAMDYERQELNGDWELSFITTLFVDELYPRLAVGQRTFIHDGIVNNGVLRVLTRTYGLEKRLLASVYEGQALSRNKSIQSDLFEAYISGVQMQLGEEAAQAWVRAIIEPMIHLAYQDRKERSEREEAKKKERKKEKKEKGLLDPTNGGVPGLSSLESSPGVLSLLPSPMGRPLEEMEAIVYPKNPLSAVQMWAQGEGKAINYIRTEINTNVGQIYLDDELIATVKGEPKEDWHSVRSKLATKLLNHFNVDY